MRWAESAEQYVIDVIEGRRAGRLATILRGVLWVLSLPFKVVVQLRLWLYRQRILREIPLGVLVISVGNLTAGGTGKTPVVEKFARALRSAGRRVAVLSRGYRAERPPWWERVRRRAKGDPWRGATGIVSDGERLLLDSRRAGDEPFMLAKNLLPGVVVLSDRDRVRSGRLALDEFQCDTLLLDDGLQYLHLRHRVDIVLVDRQSPFGNGHLLPRGTLREPPRNLRRASHIFITKSEPGADNAPLVEEIRRHNQRAEIIECAHRLTHLIEPATGARRELGELRGRKVGMLCGIARPESFRGALLEHGATVAAEQVFPDHHRFGLDELEEAERAFRGAGAEWVLTTEKDAVRFPAEWRSGLPLFYARLEIEILSGHESWDQLVERISQPPPLDRAPGELFA